MLSQHPRLAYETIWSMNLTINKFGAASTLLCLALALSVGSSAFATASVTTATSLSLSADTAATGGSGAYTAS